MKRGFAAALVLSMIISCLTPVRADEKIAGITVGKGGTDSTVTIDTQVSYSGESSLKITNQSPEKANRFLTITASIPAEQGVEYEYGFYGKAKNASKQSVMIDWGTRHTLAPLSTSYEWTKFKYNYKHTASSGNVVIRFVFDGTVDGYWIDDLYCYKLVNGKKTGNNLVPNSGFEKYTGEVTVDGDGSLPLSAYSKQLVDQDYVPIYPIENVKIDGSYTEWDGIEKIVPYETVVYAAGRGKPTDLEVWFKCAFDDEKFYFIAETTDDLYNSFTGDTYWSGDCIQLAISKLTETYGTEFGFSVNPDTHEPFQTGGKGGVELAVTQSGTKRIYESSFTWEALFGEKPESLLFSMCAADNDGTDRQYVVQVTGGGIAEGKRNTNFLHLILMEEKDTPFMWLEGDLQLFLGDEGAYQLHIVNPGDEKNFKVSIPALGYEDEVSVGSAGYKIEPISKAFEDFGTVPLKIFCEETAHAYGIDVLVAPTLEVYQPQIDKLEGYIKEIEGLMRRCEEAAIPTDYEKINLAVLKRYIPIIREDITNRNTSRFDYLFRVLDNIYNEAKDNLNAYLVGTKAAVPATKMMTSDIEVIGKDIWADTITQGKIERRPVFLVGYGHFGQAAADIGIFSDLGVNYIQQEVGPNATVRAGGTLAGWVGGGKSTKPEAVLMTSDEDAYDGTYSLKITNKTPAEPNVYISAYQSVVVKPGVTYEFGCMMKGSNVNGAWISAQNFNARKNLPTSAEDWKEIKYEYTADKSGVITYRVACENITDALYLDNFFVREKGTDVNLLKNGDMELPSENKEYVSDISGLADILKTLRNAEENNVGVSVLLAPHYFPDMVYNKYPETSARTPGTIHFRVDSEKVREVIELHVKTFVAQIKDFKSVADICLSNEPCYSAVANAYYQPLWVDYLRDVYQDDLGELNRIYQSTYNSFDEVEMPKSPEQTPRNQDYRTFNDTLFAEFHEWMAGVVREIAPDIPLHVKLMSGGFSTMSDNRLRHLNYGYNLEDFMAFSDVSGVDGGGNYGGGEFLINEFLETSHLSVYSSYDLHSSLKEAPVYNTEDHLIADGSTDWVDAQAQHVGRHIWEGALHGRGASAIWVWATSYTNRTLQGSILYRPDCIVEVGRSALDLNRLSYEVSAIRDADRDIGILYSYMTQGYNYVYHDSSFGIYSGLVYNGVMPLYVSERATQEMDKVKILFVPNVTNAYETTIDALNRYLDKGGKVIIMGENALQKDEKNQPHAPDKLALIFERSTIIPIETAGYRVTSPNLYEITNYIRHTLIENNMDIVTVTDVKTGLPPKNVEWQSAYYNGKLLVDICNFGSYDLPQELNIYVRGQKVEKMKELRFNQTLRGSITVDAGKPLLLEIDTPTTFTDTYRHWAEAEITALQNNHMAYGVTDTKFCPEMSLSRAEWTAFLMRAAGRADEKGTAELMDMRGHWAENTVSAAYELGLLEGLTADGSFEPDQAVTREEMSRMVYLMLTKVMGRVLPNGGEVSFADEDSLRDSNMVKSVCAAGLLSGYPDRTFKGEQLLTRAEGISVLSRLMNME